MKDVQLSEGIIVVVGLKNWFVAPDGKMYKAIAGAVASQSGDVLTLAPPSGSGDATEIHISGTNIITVTEVTDINAVSYEPPEHLIEHEGELVVSQNNKSNIYSML